MKQVLLLAVLFTAVGHAPSSTSFAPQRGIAKFYSPDVMEAVARSRGLARPGSVDGLASVPNCSRLGTVVVAAINGRTPERYLVVDCSHPRDRARHIRQGLVIEVDYRSAVRNRFCRQGSAPAVIVAVGNN
jgi:hypothetical protein